MDQLGNDLKKMLKAGLGAVATGLEKAQDAIEDLSKKGEPIYEQAKAAVTDAVDKAKQAINEQARPQVDDFVNNLQKYSAEELAKVRKALDDLAQKAQDVISGETAPDGAQDAQEAPAEEAKPQDDENTQA